MKKWALWLFALFIFAIPIEHKYEKPFHRLTARIVPKDVHLPVDFDKKIQLFATDIAAILLLGLTLFAFRVPLRKCLTEKGAPFLWVIFLCALGSIIASPLSHYPLPYIRLLQLLSPMLLYLFVAQTGEPEKKTTLFFTALGAAAFLQVVIALTQYFTQRQLGLTFLSESQMPPSTLCYLPRTRWALDNLFGYLLPDPTLRRATGTLPHPNILGGFLALSILGTYAFLPKAKRLLGLFIIVQVFALATTYCRSAIFGLTLGTIFWIAFRLHRGDSWRSLRYLACIFLFAVSLTGLLLFDQYVHRGGVVNYSDAARGSDQVRIKAQSIAAQVIQDNPLLGLGYQQFCIGAQKYTAPKAPDLPHNIFLALAGETGLISLGAFLLFIGYVMLRGLKRAQTPLETSLLSMFIAMLFIGCCDFSPLVFQQEKMLFFLIAGCLQAYQSRNLVASRVMD